MSEISIHNSVKELNQSPEVIGKLGIQPLEFSYQDRILPYGQKITCPELTGPTAVVIFLHGIGSIGHDNYLQLRIPAKPLVDYCEQNKIKAALLFPQCEKGFQWVDVPWDTTSHTMPEEPSFYMTMALELLQAKIAEFTPEKLYGMGISMGGYGIWDMACRSQRPFDGLGVMCGGADTAQAPRFKDCRIYMIHGAKDTAVPVCRARDMAAALKDAGCQQLQYVELPDAEHNVWDPFFDSPHALDWVFGKNSI